LEAMAASDAKVEIFSSKLYFISVPSVDRPREKNTCGLARYSDLLRYVTKNQGALKTTAPFPPKSINMNEEAREKRRKQLEAWIKELRQNYPAELTTLLEWTNSIYEEEITSKQFTTRQADSQPDLTHAGPGKVGTGEFVSPVISLAPPKEKPVATKIEVPQIPTVKSSTWDYLFKNGKISEEEHKHLAALEASEDKAKAYDAAKDDIAKTLNSVLAKNTDNQDVYTAIRKLSEVNPDITAHLAANLNADTVNSAFVVKDGKFGWKYPKVGSQAQAGLLKLKSPLPASFDPERKLSAQSDELLQKFSDADIEIPAEFLCPLTRSLLEDPVATLDGNIFERKAIEEWFRSGNTSSPITDEILQTTEVIPMPLLKNAIKRFVERAEKGQQTCVHQ